jgi:long-chain acyl-CoA synthetase
MIDLENVEKFAQDQDVPFSNYASLTRAAEQIARQLGGIGRLTQRYAE